MNEALTTSISCDTHH